MTAERWADIPGWVGLYQVSDLGRVRSLDRVVTHCRGHRQRVRGRMLKPWVDRDGYHRVQLCRDGETIKHRVHRLVLLAFVGESEPCQECRHLNGDPADNRLENLAWGTKLENSADRLEHGTAPQGIQHGQAKLTEPAVRMIRKLGELQVGPTVLGLYFGVSPTTACAVINRRTYPHVTDRPKPWPQAVAAEPVHPRPPRGPVHQPCEP
jgi:hypothetical protein